MMKKLAIPLSLVAAASLSACMGTMETQTRVVGSAESSYVASAGTAIPIGGVSVRPGAGKITSLTDPQGPVSNSSTQRVTMKMRDGSLQSLFVAGVQLEMGETIRIRSDNSIARHL